MAPSRRPSSRSAALLNAVAALPATRLSSDLAVRVASLTGRVQSVHRAAVYLELGSSGDLLVLAIADVGGIPGGILVEGIADLRTLGIAPGMALAATPEGLAIPAAGILIDLAGARAWSPALPADARLTGPASAVAARATSARAAAARIL